MSWQKTRVGFVTFGVMHVLLLAHALYHVRVRVVVLIIMAENLRSTVRKSVGFYKETEEKDFKRRGALRTAAVSKSDELFEIEVDCFLILFCIGITFTGF